MLSIPPSLLLLIPFSLIKPIRHYKVIAYFTLARADYFPKEVHITKVFQVCYVCVYVYMYVYVYIYIVGSFKNIRPILYVILQ